MASPRSSFSRGGVISLNCASIFSHKKRIAFVQYLTEHRPSVVLLQETGIFGFVPIFDDYSFLHLCAPRTGKNSGTAILYRKDSLLRLYPNALTIGETTLAVGKINNSNVVIGSVYLPCQAKVEDVRAYVTQLGPVLAGFDMVIVGGDFNCPFAGANCSPKASALLDEVSKLQGVELFVPLTPTFRSGSTLDLFLYKDSLGSLPRPKLRTLPPLSDHNGVALHFGLTVDLEIAPKKERLCYDNVDWDRFNSFVASELDLAGSPCLSDTAGIDKEVDILTAALSKAVNLFLLRPPAVRRSAYADLPLELWHKFKMRSKLIKAKMKEKVRVVRNPVILELLEHQLIQMDTDIEKEMKKFLSDSLGKKLSNIHPGQDMFKEIRKFLPSKQKPVEAVKGDNGALVTDNKGICKEFMGFYSKLYAARPPPQSLPSTPPNGDVHIDFNLGYLLQIIKALPNKKSAGPDQISNFLIKKLSFSVICRLGGILDAALKLNYFPTSWKTASIIVLPKKANSSDPAHFRPISMVNCFGKILEKVVKAKLIEEVEKLKLLPDYQFGFRAGHSTIHAAYLLKKTVENAFAIRKSVATCFLDIKKAFDSVWTDGLIWKLRKAGVSDNLVRLITSFLTSRSARVSINGELSDPFDIGRGVPQGTVLGPILYNLYVADQPAPAANSTLIQYADDTACLGISTSPPLAVTYCQRLVKRMEEYYKDWGLELNGAKSEFVLFSRRNHGVVKLIVAGETIKESHKVDYLGIRFTRKLKFSAAAMRRRSLGFGAVTKLGKLLGNSQLSLKVRCLLYKTLVKPILMYGAPIWGDCSATALNYIRTAETRTLRRIVGDLRAKNSVIRKICKMPEILEDVRLACREISSQCNRHANPIVRGLCI